MSEADAESTSVEALARGRVRRLKRSKATAVDCIRQLYHNRLLSDVTFVIGEEQIPAHKVVLAARSSVFEAMFFPSAELESDSDTQSQKKGSSEGISSESDSVVKEECSALRESPSESERDIGAEGESVSGTDGKSDTEGEISGDGEIVMNSSDANCATTVNDSGEKRETAEKRLSHSVSEVELTDTSSDAFLKFLQFIYTDELEVTDHHCVQLLFLAKKFAVRPLEEKCNEFFMKSVTELSVCDLLANFANADVMRAPHHDLDDDECEPHRSIVDNLIEYIQQHSAQVLDVDNFKQLSLESVKAILDTDQLNGTELQVFRAVLAWAKHQCTLLDLDFSNVVNLRVVAKELIPLIRFPALEQSEVAGEVRESGLLTIDQLVELFSYMAVKEVDSSEGKELSFCKAQSRDKRSITFMSGDGITLPCTNEFEGGVMNYIATKGGLESYTNPMLRGEVDVKASSWMQDADPIHFVVDRAVKRCVTRAQPMQSITIEIKRWNVRPTAYLLRHYSSWDTEALRCWVLEAATEERGEWTVLAQHKDDTHLKAKGAWHIWPLSDVTGFYRFFRITQLGQNSNNHDYLACSGFELWGTLIHV